MNELIKILSEAAGVPCVAKEENASAYRKWVDDDTEELIRGITIDSPELIYRLMSDIDLQNLGRMEEKVRRERRAPYSAAYIVFYIKKSDPERKILWRITCAAISRAIPFLDEWCSGHSSREN